MKAQVIKDFHSITVVLGAQDMLLDSNGEYSLPDFAPKGLLTDSSFLFCSSCNTYFCKWSGLNI